MVKTIFTDEEQQKFKFIWDNSFTRDSQVLRPDGKCNIMFKDLTLIWDVKYNGMYDNSNTLIIDDSPLKTFVNTPFTVLHPTPFKFGDCHDSCLLDILWPVLHKLCYAVDVRKFLQLNTPKWSLANAELDIVQYPVYYEKLKKYCKVATATIHGYTILDLSEHEVTWIEKYQISKIPPRNHPSLTNKRISSIANRLLPLNYEDYQGLWLNDHLGFVNKVREVRDTTNKFSFGEVTRCNRDMLIDEDRSKLTCSNIRCKDCAYRVLIDY